MTIAACVLGIISLLLAFIPSLGILTAYPAFIGFLLGVIGLIINIKKKQPQAMGITGIILCAITLGVSQANLQASDQAIKAPQEGEIATEKKGSASIASALASRTKQALRDTEARFQSLSLEEAIRMLQKYEIIDEMAKGEFVSTIDYRGREIEEYKQNPISEISKDLMYHFMMYRDGVEGLNDYPYIDKIIELYRRANTEQQELHAQGLAKLNEDMDAMANAFQQIVLYSLTKQNSPQEESRVKTLKRLPVRCLEAFAAAGAKIADVETCSANIMAVNPVDGKLIAFICTSGQGNAPAQYELGVCYQNGKGVSKDMTEAVKWYRKAAEQGHATAQCSLGVCYDNGNGVSKNPEEAVKWYRKAAEQGHATAQNNLGVCYDNGEGVDKDMTEAVKWYRKAAEQGYAQAQCNLGLCYEYGKGVSKDMAEAVKWYRKAAEQGHAVAQVNLGVSYDNGEGVSKDYAEAMKWYRKAAEQGDAEAQNNLGECYYNGNGVSKNPEEAVKWWRKAAEQGNAMAQFFLGLCCVEGEGVSRDVEEAKKWFRKAAEQGNVEEAKKWLRKAAEQGNEEAKEVLQVLP